MRRMECVRCSGAITEPILVRSVKDIQLCDACADTLGALERQAMAPLIVAAFAQFVSDWTTMLPSELCQSDSADRFWKDLAPFGDAVDEEDITEMLEALVARRMTVRRSLSSLRVNPARSS